MTGPQEQFAELTRRTQENFKHLWEQWSQRSNELLKGVSSRSHSVTTAPGNAEEVLDAVFDFAENLIAQQRAFAKQMLRAANQGQQGITERRRLRRRPGHNNGRPPPRVHRAQPRLPAPRRRRRRTADRASTPRRWLPPHRALVNMPQRMPSGRPSGRGRHDRPAGRATGITTAAAGVRTEPAGRGVPGRPLPASSVAAPLRTVSAARSGSNSSCGSLTRESPLGRAFVGAQPGDTITYSGPNGNVIADPRHRVARHTEPTVQVGPPAPPNGRRIT